MNSARDWIEKLGLVPHPEGGYYRETYRDAAGAQGRAHVTLIHFLLEAGQISHWHRVDAAELWLHHLGAPLELSIAKPDATGTERIVLGPDINAGQHVQGIVPAHHWQSARSLGAFTLVSCVVAPGFEFAHFELAPRTFSPT